MKLFPNKSMNDAELDQRRGAFAKIEAFGHKMTQPLSFFSMLAGAAALSFLLPAIPHITLFALCGAAFVSVATRSVGWFGKSEVDDIRKDRAAALQSPQADLSDNRPAPGVANLPDLSEAFRTGISNAVSVRTLRLKNSRSAFLA